MTVTICTNHETPCVLPCGGCDADCSPNDRVLVTCPTAPTQPDGAPHTIIGCGSTNVEGPDDEGLYDCLDCGIWFNPTKETP